MIGQALQHGGGWNHDAAGTINLYTARLIGRNRPMRILR